MSLSEAGTDLPDREPPSEPQTLAAKAYELLEEMIVTGQIGRGEPLSEVQLSRRLGLGRTPVREALQKLAANHLLHIFPRRGVFVAAFGREQQFLLLEVRRELERALAVKAAERATPDQRAKLKEMAKGLIGASRAGDHRAVLHIDRAFKLLLIRSARNPFLTSAISPVHALSRLFYFQHVRSTDKAVANAHAAVMRAVAAGDAEAAAKASDAAMDELESFSRKTL
jgi:DNA-binding GntR family transcriptional regulator